MSTNLYIKDLDEKTSDKYVVLSFSGIKLKAYCDRAEDHSHAQAAQGLSLLRDERAS
jgi:hypothetical protein